MPTADPAALLDRGKAARQAGDAAAALRCFEEMVEADPAHLDARAETGLTLLALGRFAAAAALFDGILALHPAHLAALSGRAQAARGRGDRAAALDWLGLAIAAAPGHLGLRLEAAYDFLALGRSDAAAAAFAAAEPLSPPGDVRAQLGLGHAARAQGDRAAALRYFQAALQTAPADPDARLEVAAELAEAGETGTAAALIEAVLAAEPDKLQARLARGHLARQISDHAAALVQFDHAVAAHPQHLPARIARAETLLTLGRPAEAEAALRAVLAEHPDDMAALLTLSEIAWLGQDLQRCLTLAEAARAAHPAAPAPVLQVTRALMDLGRTAEALAILEPAGARLFWPPALRARQGEVLRRDGQFAAAEAALAAGPPEDYGIWVQHVLLHLTTHRLDAADALLRAPPARTPFQRAYAAHLRGQVAEARWQLAAAAAQYRAAMAEDPSLAWPHAELARICLLLADLDGCAAHQAQAMLLDASAHTLRRARRRATSTHLGQIWDEARADARLVAELTPLTALPPEPRIAALRALLRREPDTLLPSLLLLVALRQAGWFAAAPAESGPPIPRRIVQFWDEPEPPADVAALMASWPAQHPDFACLRFDTAAASAWLRDTMPREVLAAFVRARFAAQRADIFRLAYLSSQGGVWADADDRCLSPVTPLLAPGVALAGWQESFGSVGNNLLAAAPGHPAVGRALKLAVAAMNAGDEDIAWLSTGPGALSRALAQSVAESVASGAACVAGLRIIERGEAAGLAAFHQFAAYKRTKKHWLRAEFATGDKMDAASVNLA